MKPRRLSLLASALLLGASASACTRVGVPAGGEPPPPEAEPPSAQPTQVRYTGIATLSERRVPVVLELRTGGGGAVMAQLRIPEMEMLATGEGGWRGSRLTLELAYDTGCPGSVRIDLEQGPAGRLSGALRARDCTGEAEGPLALEAREERLPRGPSR